CVPMRRTIGRIPAADVRAKASPGHGRPMAEGRSGSHDRSQAVALALDGGEEDFLWPGSSRVVDDSLPPDGTILRAAAPEPLPKPWAWLGARFHLVQHDKRWRP